MTETLIGLAPQLDAVKLTEGGLPEFRPAIGATWATYAVAGRVTVNEGYCAVGLFKVTTDQ